MSETVIREVCNALCDLQGTLIMLHVYVGYERRLDVFKVSTSAHIGNLTLTSSMQTIHSLGILANRGQVNSDSAAKRRRLGVGVYTSRYRNKGQIGWAWPSEVSFGCRLITSVALMNFSSYIIGADAVHRMFLGTLPFLSETFREISVYFQATSSVRTLRPRSSLHQTQSRAIWTRNSNLTDVCLSCPKSCFTIPCLHMYLAWGGDPPDTKYGFEDEVSLTSIHLWFLKT